MLTAKGTSMTVRILGTVLGLLFVFAGATKLAGMQMHVEHFAHWGYPSWFRLCVGAVELVFGVLLFLPRFAFIAACALALDMAGAVYTELFRGDAQKAAFPLVILIILAAIAYRHRS